MPHPPTLRAAVGKQRNEAEASGGGEGKFSALVGDYIEAPEPVKPTEVEPTAAEEEAAETLGAAEPAAPV